MLNIFKAFKPVIIIVRYCFIIMLCSGNVTVAQQQTVIEGDIDKPTSSNITLTLCRYINITDNTILEQVPKNNHFKFIVDLKEPGYFMFNLKNIDPGILMAEPGDSIHMSINTNDSSHIKFSGKGSEKLNYYISAEKKFDGWLKTPKKFYPEFYKSYFGSLDSCRSVQLNFLDSFKSRISPTAYRILWGDVFYDIEYHKMIYLLRLIGYNSGRDLAAIYEDYKPQQKQLNVSDTLALSRNYINYLFYLNQLEVHQLRYRSSQIPASFQGAYAMASKNYTGHVREHLLAFMLLNQLLFNADAAVEGEKDYLKGQYDKNFKDAIAYKYNFLQKFSVGKPEIDFSLPDTNNKSVALNQLKGRIVLLDFWFNGCTGCAALFKAMQTVTNHFKNNPKVVFVNVSVDRERERWLDGIQLYNIGNETNLYTSGKGENDQVIKSYDISGFPAQFLIGKDGNYISSDLPRADLDNGERLITLIENSLRKN